MHEGLHKVVPADDTIIAISTPIGRSGIGVVRLSGSESEPIATRFMRLDAPMVHRHTTLGWWVDENGIAIDQVVATLFRGPYSYTGEDVLEISAHGNPMVLSHIMETARNAGARIATPGEFTLRAVLNGKMDLIQAEAVRNFVDAQTAVQARTALLQIGGALSKRIFPAKETLIDIIAHLEAGIDFADDDVEPPDALATAERIERVSASLKELQQSYGYGRLLSVGLRLAIVGKPNVGKSSLFNWFVGSDRAIVTNIPGTTRDVLTESVSMDGIPLRFFDTAGMRDTADPIEKIGVARTIETLSEADLVIVVLDGAAGMDELDLNILSRTENTERIIVINKCDLPQAEDSAARLHLQSIHVSVKTREGMDGLETAIRQFLESRAESVPDSIMTSARQFESVSAAVQMLDKSCAALADGTPHEMVLLDVYEALSHLNELTGEVVTEDILGRIFSTFCVGK